MVIEREKESAMSRNEKDKIEKRKVEIISIKLKLQGENMK
jgi:hypothetical protein